MKTNNLSIRVCMKSKRIFLPRRMIGLLGNPTHLSFWYDEENGNLLISAASKDDLDAYEIPPAYWVRTKNSCAMARIAFLKALQYRLGWKDDGRYSFEGILTQSGEIPAAVFRMTEEMTTDQ